MNDFERMIRQFLAHIDVERGLSKATVSAYGADLKKYRQWLANRGINDITSVTTQDVENYVAFLDESGESARSKARRLASIHAFHRFAVDEHSVADDVSAQVKAPKVQVLFPMCWLLMRSPDCWKRFPFPRTELVTTLRWRSRMIL